MAAEESIAWRDVTVDHDPTVNSYVITLVVTHVKKVDALQLADEISELVTETFPDLGDVIITTAHLKGSIWNKPADAPE